ncbi:Predicted dehydrogenase [Cyclobacterium lianum]|uniref:Predicted dehydrogenase n=1 Tax=Cyclobacterium lianum TaxID=388280 RepID=A0A1M7NCX1_9BACT|nr:Gfo/Idh/MocA family oxidoreductase [Cyclobacterium lianum]SHN01575.1 Predicted dehydrogenase [Cyclobacterium lianum]
MKLDRRNFIMKSGLLAGSLGLGAFPSRGTKLNTEGKVRIGIVGGRFGATFQFHEHPNCRVEAVSDLRQDRRDHLMETYACRKSYPSLEQLLGDPKVDAVFLATPAPDHATHTIASLKAGKHVLCAVPLAMTVEECEQVKEAVLASGKNYMMAETSTYMQGTISARKFYQEGKFGEIFSAAAEYNHPGLEVLWFENGAPTWRHGLPPMHYPTHCTALLISVTGERLKQVSCVGWGDGEGLLRDNPYQNPFWNETAFFQTNRNHPFRVEVNWKGALRNAERGEWRGEKMSLYLPTGHADLATMVTAADQLGLDDAGFEHTRNRVEAYDFPQWWNTYMLPEPMRHNSGHDGSHTFITHEFISSILEERRAEVDIYEALAYTVPGIIAHQSALKGGDLLTIPDYDD